MTEQTPNTIAGAESDEIAAFSFVITGKTQAIKIATDKKINISFNFMFPLPF